MSGCSGFPGTPLRIYDVVGALLVEQMHMDLRILGISREFLGLHGISREFLRISGRILAISGSSREWLMRFLGVSGNARPENWCCLLN